MARKKLPKGAVAWSFYDWGNSAFSTTVEAGFLPIFISSFWGFGYKVEDTTFWWGTTVSTAGLIMAILSPGLGALADRAHYKKRALLIFALLGIIGTTLLAFIPKGYLFSALISYIIAHIGFAGSIVFYNALLPYVSDEDTVDFVSAMGYGLGYLGGGLLFAINVIWVLKPEAWGFADKAQAVQFSFLSVGVWWFIFTLPLLLRVKEPHIEGKISLTQATKEGFQQLITTFKEVKKYRNAFFFLIAYFIYIDRVHTIIVMATKFGKDIGLKTEHLITALLLVQFVGFPFTFLMGWIGQKIGPRPVIFFALIVYSVISIWSYFLKENFISIGGMLIPEFFGIAFLIAMVQGAIQSLSRSFYARLIPEDKSGEFFGFFSMVGKFSAIIGPFYVGSIAKITENPRMGIIALILFFFLGGIILATVKEEKPRS